jgi:NAD(P)-dependent dehydrogenase (short-subunit alcohol dehydrogenase family)
VKTFAAGFEAVDHVVFCVGIGSGKFGFPFWNLEPSDWARVLEVNLVGAVNVAHALPSDRAGSSPLLASIHPPSGVVRACQRAIGAGPR